MNIEGSAEQAFEDAEEGEWLQRKKERSNDKTYRNVTN